MDPMTHRALNIVGDAPQDLESMEATPPDPDQDRDPTFAFVKFFEYEDLRKHSPSKPRSLQELPEESCPTE
tara:strand:- start:165 stop:377 length:213 start_codon:yes stop_codon:yes gene_type:complete